MNNKFTADMSSGVCLSAAASLPGSCRLATVKYIRHSKNVPNEEMLAG